MLNVEYQDSPVDQEDSNIQKSENLDCESKNWNTHECEHLQQNELKHGCLFPGIFRFGETIGSIWERK